MSLMSDLRVFDNLYLKFREHDQSDRYADAIKIISEQAAIYRTVQFAGGIGKVLATAGTKPDSLERDLAVLRVENNVDENCCRARTLKALRELGLSEDFLAAIAPELETLVGPLLPGQARDIGR